VDAVGFDQDSASDRVHSDSEQAFLPFRFYAEWGSYEKFLEGLQEKEGLLAFFRETASLDVIGSGGLSSIILEEVGKNAFEHGKGIVTHLAIAKVPELTADSEDELRHKLEGRLRAAPDYAQSFYAKLGNIPCLEVVLSDCGPGIPRTLERSYKDDKIIPDKKNVPTHSTLIEYAFLLHSSSKEKSWYVSAPDNADLKYQAPRGLFFVKNIARRNGALLVCRSDGGLFAWDFLSSPSGLTSGRTKLKVRGRRRPISFRRLGGTHVRLLIPIRSSAAQRRSLMRGFSEALEHEETKATRVFPVAKMVPSHSRDDAKAVAQAVVSGVHRSVLRSGPHDFTVLDFMGTKWTKDSLFPVVSEISHLSLDGHMIGVFHTSHFDAVLDEMVLGEEQNAGRATSAYRSRPFTRLSLQSDRLSLELVGAQHVASAEKFRRLLAGKRSAEIDEELDHLIAVGPKNSVMLRFDPSNVEEYLIGWRSKALRILISDSAFGVYHPGKFLLPTSPYVEGFYEIGALLDSPDARILLREALAAAYHKVHKAGTPVVCVSRIGIRMGELLREDPSVTGTGDFIAVPSADNILRTEILAQGCDSILILIDVVASGFSLKRVAGWLHRRYPNATLRALAVLDIREEGVLADHFPLSDGPVGLTSLHRLPTTFHHEKPHSWSYSEIRRIHPVDWRPLQEEREYADIWAENGIDFVRDACVEAGAIRMGHYQSKGNGNHYRFFFTTKRITEFYRSLIVDRLCARIGNRLDVSPANVVTHILLPKDSQGVRPVAELLSVHFGGARIVPVDRAGDPRTFAGDAGTTDAVVVLDSACSSNRTASFMIDAATTMKPHFLYVCVFMSRAPVNVWRFLSEISGFRRCEVVVDALTRVEIPVYQSEDECPLCAWHRVLDKLISSNRYGSLGEYLRQRYVELKPLDIGTFINDDAPPAHRSCELSEIAEFRILLERSRVGTGTFESIQSSVENVRKADLANLEHLVRACQYETTHIFDPQYGPPPDLRERLSKAAERVLLESPSVVNHRAAIEMLGAISWNRLRDISHEYALRNAMSIELIEMLLSEHLILAERGIHGTNRADLHGELASLLKSLHQEFEKAARSVFVHPDVLALLSSVRRGLDYEVSVKSALEAGFVAGVAGLLRELRRKGGGTHSFVSESLVNLFMLSCPQDVPGLTRSDYGGSGGLAECLFERILPQLAAIEAALEVIDSENVSYLLQHTVPSLKTDLYLLNEAIVQLRRCMSNGEGVTEKDIAQFFNNDQVDVAKQRLNDWLGADGGPLVTLLEQFECDVAQVVAGCCDLWEKRLTEAGIQLSTNVPSHKVQAAVWPLTARRVVEECLRNCCKHAFPTGTTKESSVLVRVYLEEERIVVDVADNGMGTRENTDAGLGRCRELLAPFDGMVEAFDNEGHLVKISLQRWRE